MDWLGMGGVPARPGAGGVPARPGAGGVPARPGAGGAAARPGAGGAGGFPEDAGLALVEAERAVFVGDAFVGALAAVLTAASVRMGAAFLGVTVLW